MLDAIGLEDRMKKVFYYFIVCTLALMVLTGCAKNTKENEVTVVVEEIEPRDEVATAAEPIAPTVDVTATEEPIVPTGEASVEVEPKEVDESKEVDEQKESDVEKISDDQAQTAIQEYCYSKNPDLKNMVNDDQYTVYWEVSSSEENEVVILFRSYTGALNYYYIDRNTGDVYVTECVPGIIDEEQKTDETFNIKNYLD